MADSAPQVAQCEDYDSDASSAKPGTKREARRPNKTPTMSSRPPPRSLDRYRSTPRDVASDSGYSSHTSSPKIAKVSATAPPAMSTMPPPPRPASQSTSRPTAVLHRSESQRSRDKAPLARSGSTSGRRETCGDVKCSHTACYNARMLVQQRRHSGSHQYSMQPPPQASRTAVPAPQPSQEPALYQYQYAQLPQRPAYQTVPVLAAAPQLRPVPVSKPPRPTSIHGYSYPSNIGVQQGPPPAQSAYQNAHYVALARQAQQQQQQQLQQEQWRRQQQQQQVSYQPPYAYSAASISPVLSSYPQQMPIAPSPTSPDFRSATGFSTAYPAHHVAASTDFSGATSRTASQIRTYSARQAAPVRPSAAGMHSKDDPDSSDYSQSDSSASDYSDEERERHYRPRARDSRLMSATSDRRPSIKRQYATAPVVPTRENRDLIRRNPHSDTRLDYLSSSDNMDSDRTACAVVDTRRRAHTSSSHSSRRPSVSTTASSGRTKATTVSSASGLANVTVERNGRHITYLSKRERDKMDEYERRIQLQQRQQQARAATADILSSSDRRVEDDREDRARAYIEGTRGPAGPFLTTQDIIDHEQRTASRSGTGISGGSGGLSRTFGSRRGSRSSSRTHDSASAAAASQLADGIRIVHGGNIVHLPPFTPIEMHSRDDGSSTLIIGTAGLGSAGDSRSGSNAGVGVATSTTVYGRERDRESKYHPSSSSATSRHSLRRTSQSYGSAAGVSRADGGSSEGGSRYGDTIREEVLERRL